MSNVINFNSVKTKTYVDTLSDEQLTYDKKIMNNVYTNEIEAFESMLQYVDNPKTMKMWMTGWLKDKKIFLKKDIRQIINESVNK